MNNLTEWTLVFLCVSAGYTIRVEPQWKKTHLTVAEGEAELDEMEYQWRSRMIAK